ncbi:hypothetical protein P167DRAFT_112660 [Morchella conica CCBAS932]|uniref:DUF7881 domain-containing protein n=1 Tax=Morchella conica CCBAS932 TaxID=1392247 RepID=A0A3N4KS15_9PEZI|nr:hypothetical protein P167DRAFT_112660 [Morchella conica CCBAS932]
MLATNRSAGRNVCVFDANDANDPDRKELGGLILTNGVTNANFYSMVEVFLFFNDVYFLRREDGTDVQRDEQALRPGNYYIVTEGSFVVNNEPWLVRRLHTSFEDHWIRHNYGDWITACSVIDYLF